MEYFNYAVYDFYYFDNAFIRGQGKAGELPK